VRDEASDLEDDSYEQDFEEQGKTRMKFMEVTDPSVKLGFELLSRLL
jgi:hypothetical protein